MTNRETLERAADAGGILVHSWSLKDHAALVAAIRSLLKENERLRVSLAGGIEHAEKLQDENERLRGSLAGGIEHAEWLRDKLYGKLECGHHKYNDDSYGGCVACGYHKQEARIEAALDAAEDVNVLDDYRKIERVVKALKGEEEK